MSMAVGLVSIRLDSSCIVRLGLVYSVRLVSKLL